MADERERAEHGRRLGEELAGKDVTAVAVTFVDNSGVTRFKGVPVGVLERAAAFGVGATPVFDAFGADDLIADTPIANPAGDLRLRPDLDRLVPLAGQPGWAWAPGDRYAQDGSAHPGCARLLLGRMVERLAGRGLVASAGIELEWVIFQEGYGDEPEPVATGPAYGLGRLVDVSDYAADLLRALAAQGVQVAQFHPEYAVSQFELSVAPADPVAAADTSVLVRATIRAVAARHGLLVSFAPTVYDPGVGNGGHVHLSLARDGRNVFAGGSGPHGLTPEAEAFTAGILARLPALLAVGAPSVASYLRLLPSHWAGVYACWGWENREAALRLVTGSAAEAAESDRAANLEIKCFDLAANPYLLLAALLAAGSAGLDERPALLEPVQVNPDSLAREERDRLGVTRLPTELAASVEAFAKEAAITEAFGPVLTETLLALRRAEIDKYTNSTPQEIIAATRWRY